MAKKKATAKSKKSTAAKKSAQKASSTKRASKAKAKKQPEKLSKELLARRIELQKKVNETLKRGGNYLRALREEQKLSVKELAKKAKLTVAKVEHIENGTGRVRISDLLDISTALGYKITIIAKSLSEKQEPPTDADRL